MTAFTSTLTLFACIGLSLAPHFAEAAEPRPRIIVSRFTNATGRFGAPADAVVDSLSSALRSYAVDVVEEDWVKSSLRRSDPGEDVAAIRQALKVLKQGQDAYAAFESEKAVTLLSQAAGLMERNVSGLASPEPLVDSYLALAEVLFALKRLPVAQDVFGRLLRLDPDFVLDSRRYPSQLLEFFDRTKTTVSQARLGSVSVTSDPPGAQILLNATPRGNTPSRLVNLPIGNHQLVLRQKGFETWRGSVEAVSYRNEEVRAVMRPAHHPNAHVLVTRASLEDAIGADPTLIPYLDALARLGRADLIVFATVTAIDPAPPHVVARFYYPKGKTLSALVEWDSVPSDAGSEESGARNLLMGAANAGWISPLAAQRNETAGGGVLDVNQPRRLEVSLAPGWRAGVDATNFPDGPMAGAQVSAMWRFSPKLMAGVQIDGGYSAETDMAIENTDGVVIADSDTGLVGTLASIGASGIARWYPIQAEVRPYVGAGAGLGYARLSLLHPFPDTKATAGTGLSWTASINAGIDYVLSVSQAVFLDARFSGGGLSLSDTKITTTPEGGEALSQTVAFDSPLVWTATLGIGIAQTF